MGAGGYTEDGLVEQPAIALFAELGWQTASAIEEKFGAGGTLGRETSGEVVLAARLCAALETLNLKLPAEAITAAVDELSRDRSAMTLAGANRETWALVRDGVKVQVPDRERGGVKNERVRVVDWEDAAANDFLLVSQMTVTGQLYTCRPDLVGFVNGLPWVVIELKKTGVPARHAFDGNLTSYKHPQNGVPQLFVHNAFLIASNGTQSRIGTITADWERFFEWKRIEREDEPRRVSLEVMLRGTCAPGRLLDIAENFTLFSEHKQGLVRIDFEALAERFAKEKPKNADLERLKAAVKVQLERMVRLNRTRADYLEKFQALIEDYNSGSRNIEEIFRDLLALSRALTEEQGRHVREHLSEEELTVFDILTRPGPSLTTAEREEVKKVARRLIGRLNALLVLGWRQKVQARAKVRIAIEDALDEGLPPAYTKELFARKSEVLFEHVYEAYAGNGCSVFRAAI
jgi:type I site-specific restriction-modification system R (restriction) subunit